MSSRPSLRDLFRLVSSGLSGLEKVALACAAFGLMHATARAGESAPASTSAEEQWGSHATPRPIIDDAWSNPAATSLDHDDAWSAPAADHFRSVEQIRVAQPAPEPTVSKAASEAVQSPVEAASTEAPNALAMDQSDWNETPRGRAPGLIAGNDAWRNRAAPKTEQAVEPGAAKHDAYGQPAASSRNGTFLQIDPWSAPANANVASNSAVQSAPATAPKSFDASSQWRFALTPYVWLPRVSGAMRFTGPSVAESFGSRSVDASMGPYNYLQHLEFASMIQGEARKGDWSVFADTVFLNFGKRAASVNAAGNGTNPGALRTVENAETAMRGAMVELGGGFTVFRQSRMLVDAIGGLRYLGAKGTLDATAGQAGGTRDAQASQSQNIVNGFAGVRGRIAMTQDGRWYVPFYLDAGAGTSKVTWQAMTGIGYVMKWADVNLVYRYLAFHGSNDQLLQTVRMSGPSLGATVRF
jgi:hypothetical protein